MYQAKNIWCNTDFDTGAHLTAVCGRPRMHIPMCKWTVKPVGAWLAGTSPIEDCVQCDRMVTIHRDGIRGCFTEIPSPQADP